MKDTLTAGFEYLDNVADYALIGSDAVALYLKDKPHRNRELKGPLEVLCTKKISMGGIEIVKPEDLENYAPSVNRIIQESVQIPFENHILKVAKPEYLILFDLVFGDKYGSDAYELIHHFGEDINLEIIRNLLKLRDNYDELYSKLTQAYYELV